MRKVPRCPHCGSKEVVATALVAWLPRSRRFAVRHVMDGQWACLDCTDAGRAGAHDFDPIWVSDD